jgi:hypothetical protein
MFIPAGSKSTANEEPAPDEEIQWKYEVDELGEANDIDNELKIRRWVIHQMAIDENLVIRAADDFTWADKMAHDQVKEITNEEGGAIEGILIYKWNHKALRHPLQTREGNETTTAATRRAGDGDPRHDN